MSVDVFGRQSAPIATHIYAPAIKAGIPPEGLKAISGRNTATLQWKPSANPRTAGYIIERSLSRNGPFEPVNKTIIPRAVASYPDAGLVGGQVYFYQNRSVDGDGQLGASSAMVVARPVNTNPPSPPSRVRAAAATTSTHITWLPSSTPVAGYFVERQAQGDNRWRKLNSRPVSVTHYDDIFHAETFGSLIYRVVAVALDHQEAPSTETAQVTIDDPTLPGDPVITGIDGSNGKVTLGFKAGGHVGKTAKFAILRSQSADDEGFVLGNPIPAQPPYSGTYTDQAVTVGQDYWYRVVAFDAAGNRSDLSTAAIARVGAPSLSKPSAPSERLVEQPFPAAQISFAAPPAHTSVVVQVQRGEKGSWITLARPAQDQTQVLDTNIRAGRRNVYRVIYRTANLTWSASPDEVTLPPG